MATKKTFATQIGSATGAATARVENLKPNRSSTAKHTKAKAPVAEEKIETPKPEQVAAPQLSEREDIEITAYLYAKSRGFHGGSPDEDWLRAEQEVRQRRAPKAQ